MSRPPRGGSLADLFMVSYVAETRADGEQHLRPVLRCRWCFIPFDVPLDYRSVVHHPRCRIGVLMLRWQHEGDCTSVVDEYDAILDDLEAIDHRKPF